MFSPVLRELSGLSKCLVAAGLITDERLLASVGKDVLLEVLLEREGLATESTAVGWFSVGLQVPAEAIIGVVFLCAVGLGAGKGKLGHGWRVFKIINQRVSA